MKTREINVRDPFILTDFANRRYILYRRSWNGEVEALESADLETWGNPRLVYKADSILREHGDFWAPEVHSHLGKYYLFLTLTPPGGFRGTWCFRSDSPLGPFLRFSREPLTPKSWSALDGTLHVEDGVPYLVFCHEWIQVGDGTIEAVRLKADLSTADGEPRLLFPASEARWAIPKGEDGHRVTDGPFLYRAPSGTLFMLWSGFSSSGYATGVARSNDGSLLGKWEQCPGLLWNDDGGHAMVFPALDGTPICVLHSPNRPESAERMRMFEIEERQGTLVVAR